MEVSFILFVASNVNQCFDVESLGIEEKSGGMILFVLIMDRNSVSAFLAISYIMITDRFALN